MLTIIVSVIKIKNLTNMKKLLITIIILAVIAGLVWYGAKIIRNDRGGTILDSKGALLLVSEEQGAYTYSNLIDPSELDETYEAVGYVNELSAEEIEEITQGFMFLENLGEGEDPLEVAAEIPSAAQAPAWTEAVGSLTEQQQQACNQISRESVAQACQMRHIIFNALINDSDASVCDKIFIESYRSDCHYIVSNKLKSTFIDSDGNNLIDNYETEVNRDLDFLESQATNPPL